MGQESVNNKNILTLNENQKTQQSKIAELQDTINRLSNTVAILQQELITVKALSVRGFNTGPTG